MEAGTGSSSPNVVPGGKKESELEILQRQHEEKLLKIQELKMHIETAELQLAQKKKRKHEEEEAVPDEKAEAVKSLSDQHVKAD